MGEREGEGPFPHQKQTKERAIFQQISEVDMGNVISPLKSINQRVFPFGKTNNILFRNSAKHSRLFLKDQPTSNCPLLSQPTRSKGVLVNQNYRDRAFPAPPT